MCPIIARVPTCLLRVRLSQQTHMGSREKINIPTWKQHGSHMGIIAKKKKKIKLMRKWTFAAGQGGPQENPEKL